MTDWGSIKLVNLLFYLTNFVEMSQCAPRAAISLFMTRDHQSICFGILLRVTTSAQVIRHTCRCSHQKWIWCHWNIGWWHTDDVGFWMMTCMSQLHQGWGYKRMNAWGKDSQFKDFRCRAYRAKLISPRVLWCVPTSSQPEILYLITTKMCLVYWLISISIFLQSKPCFYRI